MVFQSLSRPTPRVSTSSKVAKFDYIPSMAAALINAGSLALLDTGTIPLTGVIVAISVGVVLDKGARSIVVDPDDEETMDLVGGGVFAFIFAGTHGKIEPLGPPGRVVWCSWEGEFHTQEVERAESLALEAASKVLGRFRQICSGNPSENVMLID
jgi:exosome complex component RRP46